jgi:hypothetical protein
VNLLRQHLRLILGSLFLVAILLFVLLPLLYALPGSGFGPYGSAANAQFSPPKTLWDWMDLLIVPAMLAAGAYWLNEQTRRREDANAKDRFREEVLQKYFDAMYEIILDHLDHDEHKLEALAHVRQLRTIAVLRRLNIERSQEVLDFLRASDWLGTVFNGANLSEIDLSGADLNQADFSSANLTNADLSHKPDRNATNLIATIFIDANLSGANLTGAVLASADLHGANLNLTELSKADLSGVSLNGAVLDGTIFDEETILPDGNRWTAHSDMRRFTDPEHPQFWSPPPPVPL